ncbi:MAG: hypothetical protein U0104_14380 [Gemmatimonadales bacterium]
MRIAQAHSELVAALAGAALDPDALEPWPAWKVFKQYLHREVEDGYDAASLQFGRFPADEVGAQEEAGLFLVRQFSERAGAEGEDALVGRVIIELTYDAWPFLAFPPVAVWTHDFRTLEEWASVVEGTAAFQEAMNRQPTGSVVYYDEGTEEA